VPSITPPIGRARNVSAKVPKVSSSEVVGSFVGKKAFDR